MRFGRKSRSWSQQESRGASKTGVVASEERSALVSNSTATVSTTTPFDSDPTQELLTALGRFHRQLSNAADQADHPGWCDEAMNHLVEAAEVAVRQGWPDAVEALTNTGRILQTYEDGGRAIECVPFLEDAYEILCLMVSDLIVDTITPSVRDKWLGRYESALLDVNLAGLTLASDSAPVASDREAPAGVIIPFQLPETVEITSAEQIDEEELPVLDELPPLGKIIEGGFSLGNETSGKPRKSVESAIPSEFEAHEIAVQDGLEAEIEQTVPAEHTTRRPAGPPRIVVEVLDRMCDQLATLEKSETEKRAMHMERIEGGVQALSREAEAARHDVAERLCISMARACRLVSHDLERVSERFIDLGYAFSGVYMESLREGDTDAAQAWTLECEALIHGWQEEQARRESSAASEEQTSDVHELFAFLAEQQHDVPKDAETFTPFDSDDAEGPSMLEIRVVDTPADFADSLDDGPPGPEPAPAGTIAPAESNEDPFADIPADSDAAPESAPQVPIDELSSFGLLDAAREAAASGDGEKAKIFALRAAAHIAREEAKKAEHGLRDAEAKLRSHVESTEEARATVRSQETRVAEVESVSAQRASALNEMQARSAEVSSRLEEVNASVSEIEAQIRELEVKRDAEIERLKACSTRMTEARVQEHAASAALTEAQQAEAETRARLEQCRQDVKSALRRTAEFEIMVQSARQRLERQEGAFADIENTIRSVNAEGRPAADGEDAQLF